MIVTVGFALVAMNRLVPTDQLVTLQPLVFTLNVTFFDDAPTFTVVGLKPVILQAGRPAQRGPPALPGPRGRGRPP